MKTCVICGNELDKLRRKTCSTLCRLKHLAEYKRERWHQREKPSKKCKCCGAELSGLMRSFCSHACRRKHEAAVKRGKRAAGIRIMVRCAICGERYPVGRGIGKTCKNPECRKIWLEDHAREKAKMVYEAKCPGCGVIHKYNFAPGGWVGQGMPRVGCEHYPLCAQRETYSFIYPVTNGFELENKAIPL